MRTTATIIATTAAICLSTVGAVPAAATTDHAGGAGTATIWSEPDPGQVIGQRKARAAHDFIAYAAARAAFAAREQQIAEDSLDRTSRLCAKAPDLCG